MPHAAQLPAGAPAILGEVRPASLPRAQLVGHGRGFSWITEKICGIAEEKTPPWWWWCFGVACVIASFTVAGLTYLVSTGVGVWGHRSPVNWAWDIVNFVFWIGIGHAGTLISAILCLLRQKWRTSINRSAEAMTIFAVVCAAIFPVFHLGRIWYSWFLFPLPNSNIVWQNYRSPLEWDVFAVSTYGTVSVLFRSEERRVAELPLAARVGRVRGVDLRDGLGTLLVRRHDPGPGDLPRPVRGGRPEHEG